MMEEVIQSGSEEITAKKKYYPRAYKRLFLQNRDVQILRYSLDQKFLTLEQVARRFFRPKEGAKYPLHTAYRRLLTLQKFGLLTFVPWHPSGRKAVQATDLGEQELKNRGFEPLPVCGIDYATAEHDRRVTDVRIVFEELDLLVSWTSDRTLKAHLGSRRVPDAILGIKNSYRVALEVEIAWKGKERYQEIFSNYRGGRFGEEVKAVFYVCNTLTQLKNLAELTDHCPWVFYAMYEQLMHNGPETVFANKQDQFRLRELVTKEGR